MTADCAADKAEARSGFIFELSLPPIPLRFKSIAGSMSIEQMSIGRAAGSLWCNITAHITRAIPSGGRARKGQTASWYTGS